MASLIETKKREFVLFLSAIHKSMESLQPTTQTRLIMDTIKAEITRLTSSTGLEKSASTSKLKTCQRCGEEGLMWDKNFHNATGSWRLMKPDGEQHECSEIPKERPHEDWKKREKKVLKELGLEKEPDQFDFMDALKKMK